MEAYRLVSLCYAELQRSEEDEEARGRSYKQTFFRLRYHVCCCRLASRASSFGSSRGDVDTMWFREGNGEDSEAP